MNRPMIVARREVPSADGASPPGVVLEEWVPACRREGRLVDGHWRLLDPPPPARRPSREPIGRVLVALATTLAAVLTGAAAVAALNAVDARPAAAPAARPAAPATGPAGLGRVRIALARIPSDPATVAFRLDVTNGEPTPVLLDPAQLLLRSDRGTGHPATGPALGLRPGERATTTATFPLAPGETPSTLTLVVQDRRATVAAP